MRKLERNKNYDKLRILEYKKLSCEVIVLIATAKMLSALTICLNKKAKSF